MKCPFCSSAKTQVRQSRAGPGGRGVLRRRRECPQCRQRFTTYERAALDLPRVIKRSDQRREPFSEDKLRRGIQRALYKRPVSAEQVQQLLEEITRALRARAEREVEAEQLGREVMRRLRHLDQVAYVRFASVYQRFNDVEEFRREVDALSDALSPPDSQLRLQLSPAKPDA